LEPEFQKLSDAELKAKTDEFKARIKEGATLEEILPEAFAAVRVAAQRTIGQRHYDVQLLGGVTLHLGKIAEMKTGEGKTLVATLPLYLNSLTGRGAHLATVNDYLARRDPYWMGPIYHALGVSVASIYPMQTPDEHTPARLYDPSYDSGKEKDPWQHFRPISRKEAYQADITYGTSSEFGFDFLRDNMVADLSQCVQPPLLYYCIVDEVDNLLIDEARTPLIISAPDTESGLLYQKFAQLVTRLKRDDDYDVKEKEMSADLTDVGWDRVEIMLRRDGLLKSGDSLYNSGTLMHHLRNALSAKEFYKLDQKYVVERGKDKEPEVIIVDEFTGRKMYGRRYSEGLHQAIEAKEHIRVQQETKTYATVTIQNYFRMYEKLAGMTGTAATEAEEFYKIYKLEVTEIPTHKLMIRQNDDDLIYKTEEGKFRAVAREITELNKKGTPVLIGTVSIEKSVYLSDMLKRQGVTCQVLNAKEHEKEAGIIDHAGELGAVTVATNMAGRGVDIILGGKTPDYKPDEYMQDYTHRKVQEFIEKAEVYLKDEKGYAERKEEHQKNLKKYDNEIKKAADRIKYIYLFGETVELSNENVEEIKQLEEKIKQYSKEYLNEFLLWENEVEQELKQKSEEIQKSEKPNVLQKIKDIFGYKNKEEKLRKDIDEIIDKHQLFKEWRKEHYKVVSLGGLHIIGTERHEARRIDNQLRGRAGRQGDPGRSRFYVSLEDDIMRRFGGDRIKTVMGWVGLDEDTPIENKLITGMITDVQKRVEGYHFDVRKNLVEYDDVVNKHRELIYEERRKILSGADLKTNILDMVEKELSLIIASHVGNRYGEEQDSAGLLAEINRILPLPPTINAKSLEGKGTKDIEKIFCELAESLYEQREQQMGAEKTRLLERLVMLQIIDRLWVDHLTEMDRMRLQAGLDTMRQMRSADSYKMIGGEKYKDLVTAIQQEVAAMIFHVAIVAKGQKAPQSPMAKAGTGKRKVGRNDPCPCGSGKKYKHCHGR
jgi:preprotein translocase subunit SecA